MSTNPPQPEQPFPSRLAWIIREPLILFFVLGVGLYFVYEQLRPQQTKSESVLIQVDRQTVDALVKDRSFLLGRSLTQDEIKQVVEDHILDEILVAEAYRRGLDKGNSLVRKALLDMMRTALNEPIADPSKAQLRAFYNANPKKYAVGKAVTFDHVFFGLGSKNIPDDSEAYLKALKRDSRGQVAHVASQIILQQACERFSAIPALCQIPVASRAAELHGFSDWKKQGELFFQGSFIKGQTINQSLDSLRPTLGGEFANGIQKLEVGKWTGPIRSARGTHFVRLRKAPYKPLVNFDLIEGRVRLDWIMQKRSEVLERKIANLKSRYRIEIDWEAMGR